MGLASVAQHIREDQPAPAGLLGLPLETIELICRELPTCDLAAIRGTGRAAYHATNLCFAQRYTEYHTDFSERSLNHLHALSQNPLVRRHIRHLVVLTPEPRLGQHLDWEWTAAGHLRHPLGMSLIRRFRDDLTDRLLQCRSFILSPIVSEPETKPPVTDGPTFNPDDVACILLDIIAEAALPVKLFWYGKGMNYTSPVMDIARLPKTLFRSGSFQCGWRALENLHLELEVTPQNYTFLLDLILSATSLRKLHLRLGYTDLAVEFFEQLSRSVDVLAHLERISIWGSSIRTGHLIDLLSRTRPNLQKLSLRGVTGLDPQWLSYLAQNHRHFPRLVSIDLSMIHGPSGMFCFTPVQYLPLQQKSMFELETDVHGWLPDPGADRTAVIGVTYTGPHIGKALGVLAQVCNGSARSR
ncbi:uncharacterized protein BO80DRAFT_410102 [Aspergillus ibericus CBS 121593]|uniref:F-box domain-containing protein n=1 Tax=Aspergillus ibericus CBS 121593 TaxID=1448316 RepID=A0A395GWL3_9EURO|nr:hypothetical protein BO80DRAFT_410102 [Aspergillus ibericus CBS 121593]RAK99408.1 hypothetical protein BO80DRAFT_410102 [Aspergillus ibericus CBS 121593]